MSLVVKKSKPGAFPLEHSRVYNFTGGPATLPQPVLEEAASELLNWHGSGMSIMEISHRDKRVVKMVDETESDVLELLGLKDDWRVLFIQGGASLQFAMIPMNFAPDKMVSDYVSTGMWTEKAFKEAKICGSDARVIGSSEADNFTYIPRDLKYSKDAKYLYITSNNTIRGTQWHNFPKDSPSPLIADMSSEFLSRPLDLSKFALIHAGAQKNVGPAGVTIVVIRSDFAKEGKKGLPHLLDYRTYMETNSMYNTPPVFAIYIAGLVMKWLKNTIGGLEKMSQINDAKAKKLYSAIDGSKGFYKGTAKEDSRSKMNVTYRLPNEALEEKFLQEGKEWYLAGLSGHRSVGGIRASIYNAMPESGVDTLIEFMEDFRQRESK